VIAAASGVFVVAAGRLDRLCPLFLFAKMLPAR
jgi:hypothetical protein